jgi:hypothetical protein
VGRIKLRENLASVRLALWDESQQRLISFRQLRVARALTKDQLIQLPSNNRDLLRTCSRIMLVGRIKPKRS